MVSLQQIEGWANGDHKDFLVDGNGFEGQSGGPVIMKPGMHLASDGKAYSLVQPKLLGMMVEYTRDTVDYHVPRQSERGLSERHTGAAQHRADSDHSH